MKPPPTGVASLSMTTVRGYMGSVSFDGHVVLVEKRLRGQQSIPIEHLTSVGILNAGPGMRAIRFSVAGGSAASQSVVMGSHKDFASDPYALTFRKKRVPEFEALVAEVEAARLAR